MTGKKEQEELRVARTIMIRALILAAIVALVVSAAPVASAGTSKKPPSQAVDVERGLDAAFEDGDELFETVYLRNAQPKPRRIVATKDTDIASTKLRRGRS
jgi:hypothetical protein